MTSGIEFRAHRSLRDQLERASVSVSNNIAEGFERGTTQELLTFLYIARGSVGEVRSMLCLFERLGAFNNLRSQISNLKSKAGHFSPARGWADALQNSEIKGQRYLTERSKRQSQAAKEREQFLKELAEIRSRGAAAGSSKN
jgi:four helix bundle protein